MPRLAFVVVSLIAFAGCQKTNPDYCPSGSNPSGSACIDDGGVGGPCKSKDDCTSMPNTPVCDLMDNGGTCVQCTASDHALCTGTTPLCKSDRCVACMADGDCGTGGLCLPTGACVASDNIIHAISTGGMDIPGCGGTGNACKLERALTEVTATKNVIKLDDPGTYTPDTNNFVVNVDVTIDARNAILHKKNDGSPILMINSGKNATLFGGTIEGVHGNNGDGIQCATNASLAIDGTILQLNDESGIDASSCTLTVTNANIHDNSKAGGAASFAGIEVSKGSITISRSKIVSNRGGGITVNNNGKFVVVGNMFLSNGDIGGVAGGFAVTTTTPGNRLEFNTFAENKSMLTFAAGIQCTAPAVSTTQPPPPLTAQNNIVWNNNGSTGIQVSGSCLHAYSDIGPIPIPGGGALDGGNNIPTDPMFKGPTSDLHVKPGSQVHGKANATADLTEIASKDIDGNQRVAPADLGAYVVPAQ